MTILLMNLMFDIFLVNMRMTSIVLFLVNMRMASIVFFLVNMRMIFGEHEDDPW